MKFRAGDWVEVRTKAEILGTLDENGQLEGLPFMPQMFQYCEQTFRVYKRAHKTCDTVNQTGGRWLANGVHLDLRCDGEAYGGCQASCLVFWKEDWLKPVSQKSGPMAQSSEIERLRESLLTGTSGCTEEKVWAGTRFQKSPESADGPKYVCQATQLPQFTMLLPWWDIKQYMEDYTSGNVSFGQLFRGLVYASYYNLSQAGIGLGRPLRWLYDRFQFLRGGIPFPRKSGSIPAGQPTPDSSLNLQPGELVRVKSHKEILATLDTKSKNRGLYFDAEMVPFCEGTYRVRTRLNRFIDEKTGKLITTKSAAIILEGVWCQSRYSDCRMLCPRSIYSWWREVWLERVSEQANDISDIRNENLSGIQRVETP